jgi:hypothetical protein
MADDHKRLADKTELSHEEVVSRSRKNYGNGEEYGELAAGLVHPAR